MSKYFDKLVEINENLDKELKSRGIKFMMNEDNEKSDGDDMVSVHADSLTDDQKKEVLADTVSDAGLDVDDKTLDEISNNPEQLAGVQKMLDAQKKSNESLNTDTSMMDWDGPAILKKEYPDSDSFYVNDKEWSTDIQRAYEFPSKEDAAEKIRQLGGDYMFIWPATMKQEELGESINESDGEVCLRMDDDDLDIHGFVKWDIAEKVEFVDDEKDADVFDTEDDAKSMILDICDKFNYDPDTFSIQHVNPQDGGDGENWVSIDSSNPSATTIP